MGIPSQRSCPFENLRLGHRTADDFVPDGCVRRCRRADILPLKGTSVTQKNAVRVTSGNCGYRPARGPCASADRMELLRMEIPRWQRLDRSDAEHAQVSA